ncbi:hypothetical protein DPMN_045779 [Dreissena polymorpha]|uniref:Uncharacterized protein n=1 Tax=Dreissena polymorpha TaxID=45954 RepID=A0A9D4I086_DREPO|nr:hypothetical protein DPMN_045779 [Dreissena polymorpha]
MFGRPPRFALDAFLGLKRQHCSGTSPIYYLQQLENVLSEAYIKANDAALRSRNKGKK